MINFKRSKRSRKDRKKLNLGEYKLWGFQVMLKVPGILDVEQECDRMDAIISILEKYKQCGSGGGGKEEIVWFVQPDSKKNNLTEEIVLNIVSELKSLEFVKGVERTPFYIDCDDGSDLMMTTVDTWEKQARKNLDIREDGN